MTKQSKSIISTKKWLKEFVIDLGLCPFASQPYLKDRIRYKELKFKNPMDGFASFYEELVLMDKHKEIDTTLIVIPQLSSSFADYLDFYYGCEDVIHHYKKEEEYQLASFHPKYIFQGEDPEDPSVYTNRSPYPIIHILRFEMVAKAIESHPDTESIPSVNIGRMRSIGLSTLKERLSKF